jgi:hypothetical protein
VSWRNVVHSEECKRIEWQVILHLNKGHQCLLYVLLIDPLTSFLESSPPVHRKYSIVCKWKHLETNNQAFL